MLKRIFSILLVSLLLFAALKELWLVISFKIQQDFIATYLCEQREIPYATCKGKCVLRAKFEKLAQSQAKKDKPLPPIFEEIGKLVLYITPLEDVLGEGDSQSKATGSYYVPMASQLYLSKVFRPPWS